MSGKRGAENQITRENLGREEEDDFVPSVQASQSVMSQRKIAKPRVKKTTTASPAANPFGSFGGAPAAEPASSNPFASIGQSSAPQQPAVSMVPPSQAKPLFGNGSNGSSSPAASPAVSQTGEDEKKVQQRALNEKFAQVVAGLVKDNVGGDWSVTVQKYLEHVKSINAGTVGKEPASTSATDTTSSSDPKSLFGSSASAFSTSTLPPASGSSLFGSAPKPLFGSMPSAPKPAPSPAPAPAPASTNDEEDSSDDEKLPEPTGPRFTMDKPPTTKETPFKFGEKSDADTNKTGFQFSGTIPKKENVFKFADTSSDKQDKQDKQDEQDKQEEETPKPPPAFSFGSGNNSPATTWTPDKGIKFGDASTTTPQFSFGSSSKAASTTSTDQPKSLFGSTSTAAPAGTGLFGSKPAASGTGTGLFGSNPAASSSSTETSGGGLFGSMPSGNTPFSFTTPPAKTTQEETEEEESKKETQQDLSEKGPGEEDESVEFEQKAKLFKLVDGKFEVQGLGPLRILTHNDTKKTRVLIRAEGSGRVILNISVRKEIDYKLEGKNQVRVVDFDPETKKPISYLVRVKTGDDAEKLRGVLEKQKVLTA